MASPRGWLVGACLLGAVVPFTLIVIFPTNHKLLAGPSDDDASRLLKRWNRLHAVRTVLSLASLVVFLLLH